MGRFAPRKFAGHGVPCPYGTSSDACFSWDGALITAVGRGSVVAAG